MKEEHARVMAYRLAREIDNSELEQIGGGGGSLQTHRTTTRVTFTAGCNDAQIDTVSDY